MLAVDNFLKLPITNRLNYGCSIDMNPGLYEVDLPCRTIIRTDEYRYNDISVRMKKNDNEFQYKAKRPKKPRKNVIITPPPVHDYSIPKPSAEEVYEKQVVLNKSMGLTERYALIDKIMWKIFDREQELKRIKDDKVLCDKYIKDRHDREMDEYDQRKKVRDECDLVRVIDYNNDIYLVYDEKKEIW